MTLGYEARALVQVLVTHLLVSTVLSVAVSVLWPSIAAGPVLARVAATRLFILRLAPSSGGLVAAMLVLVAYGMWEPTLEVEAVGPLALTMAVAGLCVVGAAVARTVAAVRHTARVRRALGRASCGTLDGWLLRAQVVETRFPVVALVGLVVPRLFVARRVLESCTAEEFDAVIAHEQAHASRHDNLRRLAMTAAPDLLGVLPAGVQLQRAWAVAAELAADEWAARRASSGLPLAAALVKVARLATTPVPPLTASALSDGQPIADRVYRLLELPAAPAARRWPLWALALAPVLLIAASFAALPFLHALAERILKLGI